MKPSITKAIRTFHVWAGLTLGTLFCLMSLTGSLLVFRPAIEDLLRPAWKVKSAARPAAPLTEATRNIATRWPDSRVSSVTLPSRTDAPVEFGVRTSDDEDLRVFADARSGEVLGTFSLPWLVWLTDLHHHVQLQSLGGVRGAGKRIVGLIGICLLLSSLTGLFVWAPRPARWLRLFGKHRPAGWQFNRFDVHRSVGVIGSVALLFISATGITIAFPQTLAAMLGGPSETSRQRAPRAARADENVGALPNIEQYLAAATNAVPGAVITQVRLSPAAGRSVTARLRQPGDIRQEGSTRVSLDPATASVVSIDQPSDWPMYKKIVQAATPLHYAEWGGMPVRVLWSFIGLMPPALFVSGILLWWTPFRAKRRAARMRELAREEAIAA